MYMFNHLSTLCVGLVLFISTPSNGQLPLSILNCPSEAMVFQDTENHKEQIWKEFSSTSEAEVEFAVAINSISPTKVEFTLLLDLDGNNEPETRIDSRSLPEAGMIPYNNEFSIGEAVSFGTDNAKFQFAIQKTQEGTTSVARVVFLSGNDTNSLVLPQGNHAILWSVSNEAGESASCYKAINIKAGSKTKTSAQLSLEESNIKADSFE